MGDPRYPLHIKIIGILYKDNCKLYMASVIWSDQSEVIVYRSLRDFKQLHTQLKKRFPVDLFSSQGRVLPRFGGGIKTLNFQKKTPAQCVHRVKALERYCTELLSCEPNISQCTDLIRFFVPNEQELHPEFVHNSVIIFQPENRNNSEPGEDLNNKCYDVGNVSQPFVPKLYRCVATYETKDTKNRMFKVAVDETLEVIIKDQAGWWLVENEAKQLAWFPAPYLELCENEEENENELDSVDNQTNLYCATRNISSESKDELSVTIGAVVEVLQKSDNGWWLASYKGNTGYVPSIFLHPHTNPLFGLQRKLHSSTLNLSTLPTCLSHPSHNPQKFYSLEILSKLSDLSSPVQHDESSRKSSFSDDTDFSSCSSYSLGLSLCFSDEDEHQSLAEKHPEHDSGLGGRMQSLADSQTSRSAKLYPRVPPRPCTQEILSRCTTYTRKAALATQARLFPEKSELKVH
ncbi:NADPH oxidase organizer 1b [Trichomycterus rosablanca]|uniref:NADPH oxidase organizer 1b n=1 Tax=Trichomycterus rosablanca TaxID=2290929 RepID=UPI002F34F75E